MHKENARGVYLLDTDTGGRNLKKIGVEELKLQ